MATQDEKNPFEDVGRRLALVRRALGLNQKELSEKLNVLNSRWSNWELGGNQIPPSETRKLKHLLPGLTQDWVYDGDRSGLPHRLAELLDKLESEPEEPTKKRGRPSRH